MESVERIVPHFREEFEHLKARLLQMGGMAEEEVRLAVQGLVERNSDITPDGKRFLGLFSPGDDTMLGATASRQIQMVLNWTDELQK